MLCYRRKELLLTDHAFALMRMVLVFCISQWKRKGQKKSFDFLGFCFTWKRKIKGNKKRKEKLKSFLEANCGPVILKISLLSLSFGFIHLQSEITPHAFWTSCLVFQKIYTLCLFFILFIYIFFF